MKAPKDMDLYGRIMPAGTEIVLREEPWMQAEYRESYLDFLDGILTLDSEVLEFESGSSSIYMAKRVKHLTTFERNEVWYKIMQEEIAKEGITNITIHLIPDYADTLFCIKPCFDIAVVDNWIKGSPEKHIRIAMDCLRTGGYLLFHKGDEQPKKEDWILLKTWGDWKSAWRKPG